jgi:DNA-binding IclR family transcriptional regulator
MSTRAPRHHRTVDRVTEILELAVYRPGITFSEIARALDAPRGSVHGVISGLLANGWLYEDAHHFYLGPAFYGLTLWSGHIRAGLVTHDDLAAIGAEVHAAVFLGVQLDDHLIYVAEVGSEQVPGTAAQSDIRRPLLRTAGGKVLLAARAPADRETLLRRLMHADPEAVDTFLVEYDEIKRTGTAVNIRLSGTRFALATVVRNQAGDAVASVTVTGQTVDLQPRIDELRHILLRHVASWSPRSINAREPI